MPANRALAIFMAVLVMAGTPGSALGEIVPNACIAGVGLWDSRERVAREWGLPTRQTWQGADLLWHYPHRTVVLYRWQRPPKPVRWIVLGITTTDIVGANGYSPTNYTADFGGTSSAAPLASRILALLLTDQPTITLAEVRERLNRATRKIGTVAYTAGRNNQYGYGAVNARTLLQEIFRDGFQTGNLTRWSNF